MRSKLFLNEVPEEEARLVAEKVHGEGFNAWTLNPINEKKVIDLSSFCGCTDVKFEFAKGAASNQWLEGYLLRITEHCHYVSGSIINGKLHDKDVYKKCRLVLNKWFVLEDDISIPEGITFMEDDVGHNPKNAYMFCEIEPGYIYSWQSK